MQNPYNMESEKKNRFPRSTLKQYDMYESPKRYKREVPQISMNSDDFVSGGNKSKI